jgi:hypothetical protein
MDRLNTVDPGPRLGLGVADFERMVDLGPVGTLVVVRWPRT